MWKIPIICLLFFLCCSIGNVAQAEFAVSDCYKSCQLSSDRYYTLTGWRMDQADSILSRFSRESPIDIDFDFINDLKVTYCSRTWGGRWFYQFSQFHKGIKVLGHYFSAEYFTGHIDFQTHNLLAVYDLDARSVIDSVGAYQTALDLLGLSDSIPHDVIDCYKVFRHVIDSTSLTLCWYVKVFDIPNLLIWRVYCDANTGEIYEKDSEEYQDFQDIELADPDCPNIRQDVSLLQNKPANPYIDTLSSIDAHLPAMLDSMESRIMGNFCLVDSGLICAVLAGLRENSTLTSQIDIESDWLPVTVYRNMYGRNVYFMQKYMGVPVFGSMLAGHFEGSKVFPEYRILKRNSFDITPKISLSDAVSKAKALSGNDADAVTIRQSILGIFLPNTGIVDSISLCWYMLLENHMDGLLHGYIIEANTGDLIQSYPIKHFPDYSLTVRDDNYAAIPASTIAYGRTISKELKDLSRKAISYLKNRQLEPFYRSPSFDISLTEAYKKHGDTTTLVYCQTYSGIELLQHGIEISILDGIPAIERNNLVHMNDIDMRLIIDSTTACKLVNILLTENTFENPIIQSCQLAILIDMSQYQSLKLCWAMNIWHDWPWNSEIVIMDARDGNILRRGKANTPYRPDNGRLNNEHPTMPNDSHPIVDANDTERSLILQSRQIDKIDSLCFGLKHIKNFIVPNKFSEQRDIYAEYYDSLNNNFKISALEAIKIALEEFGAPPSMVKVSSCRLTIFKHSWHNDNESILCWKIDVLHRRNSSGMTYDIDATTGEIF